MNPVKDRIHILMQWKYLMYARFSQKPILTFYLLCMFCSPREGGLEMYINGTLYDGLYNLTNISKEIGGNLRAAQKNPGCVEVTFKSGSGVEFCEAKGMMSFVVTLSNEFLNNTKGLLGTYNNNPDDDYTLPDGTTLGPKVNSSTIHYDFGLKCEYWFSA